MQPEASRRIDLATVDPDPVSTDIGTTLLISTRVRSPQSDVTNSRVCFALEAAAAQNITIDLWAVREEHVTPGQDPLAVLPKERFYLIASGIVIVGGTLKVVDLPAPGLIYPRVVTNNLATAARRLFANAVPSSSSPGASGGPAANVVVTGITAPLGPQTPAASLPVVLPGARGQAGAAALATFADNANVLAMRQYRVTPPVMTDTQLLLPQVDVSGNDKSAEQFAAQSENNVLNVTQVQMLPVVSPTFAMSKFVSAALATNAVVKASPGVLFSVSGRMDISAAAANYWLLAMDAASLPANGAVTIVWSTKLIMPAVQVDVPFSKDFRNGVYFASGLVFALGITTEFTLTIGAQASLKLDSVLYK